MELTILNIRASRVVELVNNLPADARDAGSIPELGRSPGVGNGNLSQYSCLQNSMDRGAWGVTVHGVFKSWTYLSGHARARAHTHTHTHTHTHNTLLTCFPPL